MGCIACNERRLGELSDPYLRRGAENRDYADRSPGPAGMGRRRADLRSGAVGAFKRDIRLDRRTRWNGTLHTRARQGGSCALVRSGAGAARPPRSRAPDDSPICQVSRVDRRRWASAKIPPAHPACAPPTKPPAENVTTTIAKSGRTYGNFRT